MRVNVTSLKIKKAYREALYDGDKDRITLEMQIGNDNMFYKDGKQYTWWPMLHSQYIIDKFIAQLHGKVPWDRKVSFDDLNYMVRTGKETDGYQVKAGYDGFEIWKREGLGAEIRYFYFPGPILAEKIKHLYVSEDYPESEYEFSPEELEAIRRRWWPKARLEFTSPEAQNRFMKCLVGRDRDEEEGIYGPPGNFPEHWTEDNVKQLRRDTRSMMIMARNYSNGEPSVVSLGTDFVDHSFYFSIHDNDGNRIINGGIIAHKYEDKDTGEPYYDYSMHT